MLGLAFTFWSIFWCCTCLTICRGTACRDGGIVKSDNLHKTIPQSASLTAPRRFALQNSTRSSFTPGSLWRKIILRWIFICFLLIGKAFMEPRHYGGVFVVQKKGWQISPLSALRCLWYYVFFITIDPTHSLTCSHASAQDSKQSYILYQESVTRTSVDFFVRSRMVAR